MTDEIHNPAEEGHTFVDKRRTADEAPAEATPISPVQEEPLAADEESEGDAFPGMDGAVGIASYAIGLMSMSAWQYLGLVADQKTGKATRDLRQARIAIDCVAGMVEGLEKNSSAVDGKMLSDIKRVLTDLKLNFVTQSNMSKDAG